MTNLLSESARLLNREQAIILAVISVGFIAVLLLLKFLFARKKKPSYYKKQSLLTATEVRYFQILNSLLGENYLVYPQINLASVLDKEGGGNFRTELFRNIDFGVFDFTFRPILLIEINDNSHLRPDRAERDAKVLEICKSAKIPLVTFWVKEGIDAKKMRRELEKYLYL